MRKLPEADSSKSASEFEIHEKVTFSDLPTLLARYSERVRGCGTRFGGKDRDLEAAEDGVPSVWDTEASGDLLCGVQETASLRTLYRRFRS